MSLWTVSLVSYYVALKKCMIPDMMCVSVSAEMANTPR